jgi:predicted nucleic acid-binding protein
MLVIDASAVAELVLRRPSATAIEQRIIEAAGNLHAPHLLDVEVLSALRRLVASGYASPARADDALTDFRALSIERYPHEPLIPRAWALRENLTPYDAVYLALAEALSERGAPLLTADQRLARAARKHGSVDVMLAS